MDQPSATLTAHDEAHRHYTQVALCARSMGSYLRGRFAPGDDDSTPTCHILDAKYEPGIYGTVLYELGKQLIIGTLRWDQQNDHEPEHSDERESIGLQVYRFPLDPALPQLAAAMKPQIMAHVLCTAIPDYATGSLRLVRCRETLLRYRPGKRCTLRLDLVLWDAQTRALTTQTLIVKLYHKNSKARAVYDEMCRLAEAPSIRDNQLVIAQALALVPNMRMVVQATLDGTPLHLLLASPLDSMPGSGAGWDGALRAVEALAALHTSAVITERARPIEAELLRFQRRAERIAHVDRHLGSRLADLAAVLPDWLDRLPDWGAECGLVHGDCKPSQFLVRPAAIALLDFDHCGIGDPASDVGTFIATLRQMGARHVLKAHDRGVAQRRAAWLHALEQQVLDTYCLASGHGLELRLRARWYQAVALMRKALRSFARSPLSPLTDALITEGWRCLQTLPARPHTRCHRSRAVETRLPG